MMALDMCSCKADNEPGLRPVPHNSRQTPATGDRRPLTAKFEMTGSVLAMAYALLIALNIGAEVLGFSLLLMSSALFAGWAILDRRWTFLVLQMFYAASAIIGLIRWA